MAASYDRLVVDEYQDCSLVQHAIIYYAAATLPTCVLGDPMQAIFGFQGNELADWERHVCVHFPVVGELNTPWRWNNAKEEEFGIWLLDVRRKLLAGEAIDLVSAPRNVSSIRLNGVDDHKLRLQAALAKAPTADGCVLIIADATNPDGQRQFASQIPGAVTAEKRRDLKDFVSFAQKLDLMAPNALQNVVYFAASVMTNVGAPDLIERIATLRAGRERREASNVERAALAFAATPTFDGVANLLVEISKEGGVRRHRPAILSACYKALKMCDVSRTARRSMRPPFKSANSREWLAARSRNGLSAVQLLLKGLEADVSVILNATNMDKRHLYVAMTRGAKKLVICSPTGQLRPR